MHTHIAAPYGTEVTLYTDAKSYRKNLHLSTKDCCGITCWNSDGGISVYVGDGNLATLCHELAHVVLFIFDHVGIKANAGGGEPFAYLLDNLFSAFEPYIKEHPVQSRML